MCAGQSLSLLIVSSIGVVPGGQLRLTVEPPFTLREISAFQIMDVSGSILMDKLSLTRGFKCLFA